jgi:hypothetical protein
MVNFSKRTLLILSLVLALAVVALNGCNGGSPPTTVRINVTGKVLLLADDGTTPGQAGVTVTLTRGGDTFSAVTGADGTYNLTDVLAPLTYTVTVSGSGVKTSKLRDLVVPIPPGGAGGVFTAPTIYVTPAAPAPPSL